MTIAPSIPVTASPTTSGQAEWIRKAGTAINLLVSLVNALETNKLQWAAAPSAADDPGEPGQIAYESGYFYLCVGTDEWQRVALATWP